MANDIKVSVVVVGDSKIGKTALIQQFTHKRFTQDYVPTNFDKLNTIQDVQQHRVEFVIWDTSGSPAHDSVRALSYQDADVFLLCYKISDPDSLYNVKNKWIREIRRQKFSSSHQPPVVLCGCQADQRSDPQTLAALGKVGRMPTSSEQALAICCEIGAVNYVETSSIPGTIDESCGYEGARDAFEVCALAVIKTTATSNGNTNQNFNFKEDCATTSNKENRVLKGSQFKRKSILLSPSKFGQQDNNLSLHNDSISDMNDTPFMAKGIPLGMSTTSSKKSISSNTSSHGSKKSSSFSGHNVSFGSGYGLKSEIDSILEYPTSSISSRLSGANNLPCQYVSVHSHQELHHAAIQENDPIDCKDSSMVKMIHNDGSFSNLPKLPFHRNTSSPKLRNRSLKEHCIRNMRTSSNKSMRDIDHQRIQQRALSFGSSHSSFLGSSSTEKLSMSPSTTNQYHNVSTRGQENAAPLRIESDDIILLTRGNVLRESHDVVTDPISSSIKSGYQQIPQAQVRANGLSRRTSFRSQSHHGKHLPVPVSTPKSPLLNNSDVTITHPPKLCRGSVPGPQVPSILKRPTANYITPTNHFQPRDPGLSEIHSETSLSGPSTKNISSQPESILQQYRNGLTSTLASQGSAGSKTSTASSMASSSTKESSFNAASGGSNKLKIPVISENTDREIQLQETKPCNKNRVSNDWLHDIMSDPDLPNIDDPNLLNQLQFVSPKAGVFRPVVETSSISSTVRKSMSLGRGVKLKKNNACSIM